MARWRAGRFRAKPTAAGVRPKRDGAALVETDQHAVEGAGRGRLVGAQHPLLLLLIERVVGPLPGARALGGDAHVVEQAAQVLFGDGLDHSVAEQVAAQPGQRPAGAGLTEITGTGEGDVADPVPGRVIDPPRMPAPGRRAQRVHPVRVELGDHSAYLILVGLQHLGDLRRRHPGVRRQNDLRPLAQGEHLRLTRYPTKPHRFLGSQTSNEHRRRASQQTSSKIQAPPVPQSWPRKSYKCGITGGRFGAAPLAPNVPALGRALECPERVSKSSIPC